MKKRTKILLLATAAPVVLGASALPGGKEGDVLATGRGALQPSDAIFQSDWIHIAGARQHLPLFNSTGSDRLMVAEADVSSVDTTDDMATVEYSGATEATGTDTTDAASTTDASADVAADADASADTDAPEAAASNAAEPTESATESATEAASGAATDTASDTAAPKRGFWSKVRGLFHRKSQDAQAAPADDTTTTDDSMAGDTAASDESTSTTEDAAPQASGSDTSGKEMATDESSSRMSSTDMATNESLTESPTPDTATDESSSQTPESESAADESSAAVSATSDTAGTIEPASAETGEPAVPEKPRTGFWGKVKSLFHRNSDEAQMVDTTATPESQATDTSSEAEPAATDMAGTTESATEESATEEATSQASDQTTDADMATEESSATESAESQTTADTENQAAVVDAATTESSDSTETTTPAESGEAEVKTPGFWGRFGATVKHVLPGGDDRKPAKYMEAQTRDEDLSGFVELDNEKSVSLLNSALSLEDYLRLVAAKNDKIAYQRLAWGIARSDTESARGMFEPALTASYRYTDSNTPNTTEEEFRRSFAPEFIEKNTDYQLGVEKTIPTGGKIKVAYTYRHLDNNIQPLPIRGEEDKSYLGFSVTQPILKGGFKPSLVKAPIKVADKQQNIAKETFRQSMFQTISDAAMAYWDLYLADKKVEMREKSVKIAESVLKDEKQRNRYGQSSDTNVMSAESALAQRKVQLYSARQGRVQARNRMRTYLAGLPAQYKIQIDADKKLDTSPNPPSRQSALEAAYLNRPEYLASRIRAEKEDVRIQFARNNSLPQLDLVASYGLNGLDNSFSSSWSNAWSKDHKTMYVGLEYKMYLRGGKKAKSDLRQAELRKRQALLEIKAAEMSIENSIDTALSNLQTAEMQVHELDGVIATNQRLLGIEMTRFEGGQSNSRDLLQLEQRLNETMETYLESKTNLQKAVIGVELAEGTLLKQFDLED